MLLIFLFPPLALSSPLEVTPPSTSVELECSVYPSCEQYGEGVWQILEDCHKYINCTRPTPGGPLVQANMECPGDLVFANEYNECVEWDKATDCKLFQATPCLLSCPRVYIDSIGGPADEFQSRRLGCFRLSGTLFGGTLVHYQNSHRQYLSPDSTSNPLSIHWLVSEGPGAFNGGIRNSLYDYVKCPFTDWNEGWEVDSGFGNWVEDTTIHVRCHKGDEGASTNATQPATTTPISSPCHQDGPNPLENCEEDFLCCQFNNQDNSWNERQCHCKNGLVFSKEIQSCVYADTCFAQREEDDIFGIKGISYDCDDGEECPGI